MGYTWWLFDRHDPPTIFQPMVAAQDLSCALALFLLSAERTPFQFEVRRVLSLKRVTGNLTNTLPRLPRRDTPRRERLTPEGVRPLRMLWT